MRKLNKKGTVRNITFYEGDGTWFCSGKRKEDTITASEAFETADGIYLFFPPDAGEIMEKEEFRERLLQVLIRLEETVWFFWLRNPAEETGRWLYDYLPCADVLDPERRTGRALSFGLADYELILPGETSAASEDGEEVLLTNPELPITVRIQSLTFPVDGGIRVPLFGKDAGSFRYSFEASVSKGENLFQQIHAGVSYGFEPNQDCYGKGMQAEHYVCRVSAPLFDTSGPVAVKGMWNFCLPPEQYQAFAFTGHMPLLESGFSGLYGRKVKVCPMEGAGLVFAGFPDWIWETENKRAGRFHYELTYVGDYAVEIGEETEILCGISGTEYIKLDTETDWTLHFHPGRPAILGKVGGLGGPGSTAWISITGTKKQGQAEAPYYVQPTEASLFYQADHGDELLTHLEWKTADIGKEQIFPLFPWGEYRMNYENTDGVSSIEERGIAPVRQGILLKSEDSFGRAGNRAVCQAATSKGFLAEVGDQGFSSLTLVKNQGAALTDAGFTWMSGEFTRLLLKERLFLPISGREAMEKLAEGDVRIYVEDWCFDASPGSWNEDTAMIWKYAAGYSAAELMDEESMWSSTEYAGRCRQIFDTAVSACRDDSGNLKDAYREFDEIINDPDWCGLLILNCRLKVQEVPGELAFLFEDIPPEQLNAHHIRVDQNNVEAQGEGIGLKASSIYGLVDYEGESLVNETGKVQTYRFAATRLVLAVKNSSVSDFSSESELRINELFGHMAKKEPTVSGNCLIFDGTMQRNDGMASYSFALRESGNYLLSAGEPRSVEIMEAVRTGDSFLFNGRLRFSYIPECDLLSYGSKDECDGWLSFRKLLLVLKKETETGGYTDAGGLVFDLNSSIPRPDSMAARFPLHVRSFLEESKRGPVELGYRSITCPISQSLIEGGFLGLVFEIPLGSLGKNSPVSGLSMEFLYAWGLDKEGKDAVFTGVRLPGMGADGTGFRLQGFVKLDFKGIELVVQKKEDGISYQMVLRNFTLQSFGLSFPPGKNQICILGEGPDKLGWYAAYADGQEGDE